jgi:hypothetical protein
MISPQRHRGHGEKGQNFHNKAAKAPKIRINNLSLWPLRPCCEHPVFHASATLLCVNHLGVLSVVVKFSSVFSVSLW